MNPNTEAAPLPNAGAGEMADTSVRSSVPMAWQCPECRGTGAFTANFPMHPDNIASLVWEQHHEHEKKRHCVCPGDYLKLWPIK